MNGELDDRQIKEYRRHVDNMRAERNVAKRGIARVKIEQTKLEQEGQDLARAQVLVQQAALATQEHLRIRLSTIVTMALQSVFQGDNVEFQATFESKRGRTECVLEVGENGVFGSPILDLRGGGLADVVSFALRASFWSIDRTRPLLILDEPMKFLDASLAPLAADMLRVVSEKLGIQIIMVSHVDALVDGADRVFRVERANGITTVEQEA